MELAWFVVRGLRSDYSQSGMISENDRITC
jgi:hypothetical protein